MIRASDRWAVVAAGLGLVASVGAASNAPASQPASVSLPFNLRTGVVVSVDARTTPGGLTARFQDQDKTENVSLVGPDLPQSYRAVVTSAWSRPCTLTAGDDVRLARAGGLPLAVQQRKAPPSSDWEACFLRTYFDLSIPSPPSVPNEVGHALGRSLGLLSEAKAPPATWVWIRGPADRVLIGYEKAAIIRESVLTRGHPELASSVDAVRNLRAKLSSRTIVARVTPSATSPGRNIRLEAVGRISLPRSSQSNPIRP